MDLWELCGISIKGEARWWGGLDCFHHCSVLMRKRIEWDEKSKLGREHNTNIELMPERCCVASCCDIVIVVNNESRTHEAADTFNLDHLFYVQSPASL